MLFGVGGSIEIRAGDDGAQTIVGRFPYESETELAPGRFERFARRSLHARSDAYLLAAHDFARPLASRESRTLTLTDADDALTFEARITPEVAATSHGRDALALLRAGLAAGLSPGFRVPMNGDAVERRGDAIVRTVNSAEVFELSIVTRAAYPQAQVEARSWAPCNPQMFIVGPRRSAADVIRWLR